MSLLRRSLPLKDQVELDRLLDDAFAPARLRTAGSSAARVRARLAWDREEPVSRGWRAVSLLGRLGEASLGLGVAAILFVGSLGGAGEPTGSVLPDRGSDFIVRVSAPLDESRFLRGLRLGRTAPVGDVLDATRTLPVNESEPPEEVEPGRTAREQQGPLR